MKNLLYSTGKKYSHFEYWIFERDHCLRTRIMETTWVSSPHQGRTGGNAISPTIL